MSSPVAGKRNPPQLPMTAAEAFEANPLFTLSIRMREWDEQAKSANVPVPDLTFLRNVAHEHLHREQGIKWRVQHAARGA
jgi:predicted HD phosphohydrolase